MAVSDLVGNPKERFFCDEFRITPDRKSKYIPPRTYAATVSDKLKQEFGEKIYEPHHEKICFFAYAKNKAADHLHGLW